MDSFQYGSRAGRRYQAGPPPSDPLAQGPPAYRPPAQSQRPDARAQVAALNDYEDEDYYEFEDGVGYQVDDQHYYSPYEGIEGPPRAKRPRRADPLVRSRAVEGRGQLEELMARVEEIRREQRAEAHFLGSVVEEIRREQLSEAQKSSSAVQEVETITQTVKALTQTVNSNHQTTVNVLLRIQMDFGHRHEMAQRTMNNLEIMLQEGLKRLPTTHGASCRMGNPMVNGTENAAMPPMPTNVSRPRDGDAGEAAEAGSAGVKQEAAGGRVGSG
ncbi:hypothetical protein TPAR_08261 [Tolypocladium paradoxum]|uniref:Uncharacterized protein n=1 Tax=Tolypocladium paradoxum TaxID=94208 RepID=A0A2S4KMY0_9HYPO|nr:hypothetical protein TPAR_08261 [Tolypocladium paradoxum]